VPLSTPAVVKLMPVGSAPLVMSHKYGPVPPVAVKFVAM